ncbi:hypothetical protein DFP72DRAFT_1163682 [Ephemerocybe angulata]|uniref:Uncharacterized protein n=1 Tax=Ephemerocybe angulata TaxID=980116 RepID=A0A8H6IFZ5_9AGAR|nr:hypothetical protein DFP72DRAFT_1163682 [Tulosesus angulatus]
MKIGPKPTIALDPLSELDPIKGLPAIAFNPAWHSIKGERPLDLGFMHVAEYLLRERSAILLSLSICLTDREIITWSNMLRHNMQRVKFLAARLNTEKDFPTMRYLGYMLERDTFYVVSGFPTKSQPTHDE